MKTFIERINIFMKSFKEYLEVQQVGPQVLATQFIIYPNFQGSDPAKRVVGQRSIINTRETLGNEPGKDYSYFTTDKKSYVEKMVRDAQGGGWKSFEPISAIRHPILAGKYLAIDGNHRLGAFKMGGIPQINAIVIGYENILLATPDTRWFAGIVPQTIPLQEAMRNNSIDLRAYFNTQDLQLPQQNEWLVLSGLREQNLDIRSVVQQYLNSDVGKKYERYDCKTVTRAFIQWARKNGMQAQVLHLAPPSAEFLQKNPQFRGKSGEGDSHIMPVMNGYALDFTARQFGLKRDYDDPLITPIGQVESIYSKFGYFTDNPEWFHGGKSFYLGPLESTLDAGFADEIL